MQTITCNGNVLTSLNVHGLTALTLLNAGGNSMTSVDLGGCTALATADCSWNQSMTTINTSGCTALVDFYIEKDDPISYSTNAALTAFYPTLPTVTAGTLHVGSYGLTPRGSDTTVATAKHWTVSYTP